MHRADDARIFGKECRSLAAAGYETYLVVAGEVDREVDSVRIRSVPLPGGGRLARISLATLRVFRAARALRAGLYHVHDPELLPIAVLLRLGGATVVYDAHEDLPRDLESKDWIPPTLRGGLAVVVDRVELILARRMSAVVTATPTICDRFASAGCSALAVCNYPIVGEFVRGPQADFGRDSRPDVGYVGGISAIRGSRVMVEAAGIAGIGLSLAGRISEGERQALGFMQNWSNVRFLGHLSRRGVAEMLGECFAGLVVLQPTRAYRESLPIKLFEYMAAGIPVIASDFVPWRRLVEDAGCGICVDPTDPAAVAAAIRELDADRPRAREMGLRGRDAFQARFNWSSEEAKLLELYRSLVGTPARTDP